MVLVHDRASFNTVFRCVLGFGIIHLILLACLSLTPIGVLVIDGLHDIDPDLGKIVRKALGFLVPFPLLIGLTRFLSGLLLQLRRTDIVSYSMMAGVTVSIIAVILFLPTKTVQSQPILLPIIATYAGLITELLVIIYAYWHFVHETLKSPQKNPSIGTPIQASLPLTTRYALSFYWPLAVTIGIQAMSRPIINLFVARGIEGTEGLAVLTIVYALAHLPYGWLNELKNLPPAFQKLDPDTRFIRRFTVACGFLAFIFMVLMFWTPIRFFLLETLIGVSHNLAIKCTVPLIIFSFFPFAVTIRSYLHGIALRDHRTSTITLSGPARVLAIVVVVNFLMLFGFHGATCGVAALFTGFVAETIVVYWRMGKKL